MSVNKYTKAVKLIMSHYKDALKKDGVPVSEIVLISDKCYTYMDFNIRLSSKMTKDMEKKIKKHTKEFAYSLNREHPWLELDDEMYVVSDNPTSVIGYACEIHAVKYDTVRV